MAYYAVVIITVVLFVVTISAAPKDTKDSILIPIPKECEGSGVCAIKPEGYDEYAKKIDSLLSPYLIRASAAGTTITSESDDDDNCPTITTRVSAYMVNPTPSDNSRLDLIVQTELLSQSLVIVTCKNKVHPGSYYEEGEPQCFRKLGLHDFSMRPICKEVIGTRPLMVYDPKSQQIMMKNYNVPVGCACNIYNTM